MYVRLLSGIFLIGVIISLNWIGNVFFAIKNIEIVGEKIDVEIDKKRIPGNLLFFPERQIEKEIQAANPIVKSIDIQKKYPNTLVIVVSLRSTVLRLKNGDQTVLIDADGVVLGEGSNSDAPIAELSLSIPPSGEQIKDDQVRVSLELVMAFQESFPIQYITAYDSKSLRVKIDKTDIFFPHLTDVQAKLATLQTLLTGFRIKSTLPKTIDLRFDKPIVIF